MLAEIQCDKFIDEGIVRKPIKFHKGLNTILGARTAKNSIGKTTFLLIVDFCFGGLDYVTLNSDIDENVGNHTIKFKFIFSEGDFYFARETSDARTVYSCDKNYNYVSKMSLDTYNQFLFEKYNLQDKGNSFREVVNGYFRIYGKDNSTERFPLKSHGNDTMEQGIRRLMMLYGVFGNAANLDKELKDAIEIEATYKNSRKHKLINGVTNKKDYENNIKRITELEERRKSLDEKNAGGLLDIDSVKAARVAEMKRKLVSLNRQRRQAKSRLVAMQEDMDYGDASIKRDYSDLLEFFPNVNIKKIEEIDSFHKKINKVLKDEYKDNKKIIEALILNIDNEIKTLENEIKSINEIPNVSTAALESYVAIEQELSELREANDYYDKVNELHNRTKDLTIRYNKAIINMVNETQNEINLKLKKYNALVCKPKTSAPYINIRDSKSYSYKIPNDTGTGSQVRGMLLLDYVTLESTPLPAIIEDSMSIKQIEDEATIKLFELFNESTKQIFITIDKGESYSDNNSLPKVIQNTKVLELSEGHALFGKSWNIIDD